MVKKLIALFVLISCSVSAQTFQGLRFAPPVTIVGAGAGGTSNVLWDDPFDGTAVSTETWGICTEYATAIRVTGGNLEIGAKGPSLPSPGGQIPGISRTIHGDFTAIIKINYAPFQNYQTGGILAGSPDGRNFTAIWKEYVNPNEIIQRRDVVNGTTYDTALVTFTTDNFYMRMIRSGTSISVAHSENGVSWTTITPGTVWSPKASDSVLLTLMSGHTQHGGTDVATATIDYCNISRP